VKEDLRLLREAWQGDPLLGLALNALDEAAAAILPGLALAFEYLTAAYAALKAEQGGLDFDDLESLAIGLLQAHAGARAAWQSAVHALLVDEFQDTNERQRTLIRLLCPDPGKLFIVGDAKQSIYRFRGADVSVFRREERAIATQNGRVLSLDTSYRAHEALLQGMNDLLAPVLGEEDLERPWRAPFDPLRAAPPREAPLRPGLAAPYVEVHVALGSKEQALTLAASALVGRLLSLWANSALTPGDVAILCRASGSFRFYEDALDAAGLPYVTVAGRGFFERPEIRDLLNALQAIADPHDDLALAGLLRSPALGLRDGALFRLVSARPEGQSLWEFLQGAQWPAGLSGEEIEIVSRAEELVKRLHGRAGRAPVADVLKQYLNETLYRATLRRAEELRALRNVAKLLEDVHRSERVNIADFLEYAAVLRDSGSREGEARATSAGVVQIMTVHQAKGLEFPLVVLGDVAYEGGSSRKARFLLADDLGLTPYLRAANGQIPALYALAEQHERELAEAENGRLLYVAATRAEQMLFLSGHCTTINQKARNLSLRGWLKKVGEITGLNGEVWEEVDPEGNGSHQRDLKVGETAVSFTLYEGGYQPQVRQAAEAGAVEPAMSVACPLREPLPPSAPEMEDDARDLQVWQVVPTAQRPVAPHHILGTLVHEALAQWHFPDAEFEPWIRRRALERGLMDERQLADAASSAARMLRRFQGTELFRQMDEAERRLHEVPYTLIGENGRVQNGYVDVLYLIEGRWHIVDFKIDQVQDERRLNRVLPGYVQQVRRYGRAVQELLQQVPVMQLYFLAAPPQLALYVVSDSPS